MSDVKNLFKRIETLNLTKKKVSVDTGISTGNLSDWAKGRCLPSAEKLEKLADYLNCSVDYLLGRDKDITLTTKEHRVISAYKSQPEMHPAVDKLLGIDSNTEEKKYNPTIDFTAPPLEIAAWGADGTEAEYRLPIEETT